MEQYEIRNHYQSDLSRIQALWRSLQPEHLKEKIATLENETLEPNFWNDKLRSNKIIKELNDSKNRLESVSQLKDSIESNISLLKNELDVEMLILLEEELSTIEKELDELEVMLLLNKEFDSDGAVLEIHSGAGGTEACDWANMLYRMYSRWCEKKNYKIEVAFIQRGEEAGIKSLTMLVKGDYAYGYLKNEKGVHRLVRISPFDSGARRHTSFASILVTPLFDNNEIELDIKESDLKIDVYRSSGAGGQHVNTTDSAVRITHLPTKTVVTCQNERSQIQNREKAMEILKIKLYQLEVEKKEAAVKQLQGSQMEINFGSQIRSYVMHPYSLVKDHRTNIENTNVEKVLDGDIDLFINANLKRSR